MKHVWKAVDVLNISEKSKNVLFVAMMIAVNILIGWAIWLAFARDFLSGNEWLFCFAGYPAMFLGLFGSVLYLFNHEFT